MPIISNWVKHLARNFCFLNTSVINHWSKINDHPNCCNKVQLKVHSTDVIRYERVKSQLRLMQKPMIYFFTMFIAFKFFSQNYFNENICIYHKFTRIVANHQFSSSWTLLRKINGIRIQASLSRQKSTEKGEN